VPYSIFRAKLPDSARFARHRAWQEACQLRRFGAIISHQRVADAIERPEDADAGLNEAVLRVSAE
jgi:hypothetical protein